MRLKRGYEQKIRQRLQKFGRWAWISANRNTSPLNRLFAELAGGNDIEKIRKQIETVITDPEVKAAALRTLRNFEPVNMMGDHEAMKIDQTLAYLINYQYPLQRRLHHGLMNQIYMSGPKGLPLLQVARELVENIANNDRTRQAISEDDLTTAIQTVYRCLRRVREQLETDLFFALACLDKLGEKPTKEEIAAGLVAFCITYYERGQLAESFVDVKTRYQIPRQFLPYFCKVL